MSSTLKVLTWTYNGERGWGVGQVITSGIRAMKRARSKHQPTGQWIRPEKRLAIYLRDRFTCSYCLSDLTTAAPRDITLDHVIPRAAGGSNEPKNLITACVHCNCARKSSPVSAFANDSARREIRNRTRRTITRYITLAKALITGDTGTDVP
jgi:5-methylcytosine-specific restriction endonuclease McrA